MSDAELKPCPFCGGENARMCRDWIGDYMVVCRKPKDLDNGFCGAQTKACATREEARNLWNTRA